MKLQKRRNAFDAFIENLEEMYAHIPQAINSQGRLVKRLNPMEELLALVYKSPEEIMEILKPH